MINTQMMPSMLPMNKEPLIIPPMTSNSSPAGFVVTSNGDGTMAPFAYQVFDGVTPGSWRPNLAGPKLLPTWVQIQLPRPIKALKYNLNSGLSGGARAPLNWTLQGANGDGIFTTIDTRTGESGWSSSGETRSYIIDSPGNYTQYRLNITANNGDSDFAMIGELELLQEL